MMSTHDSGSGLLIPFDKLEDHLHCSICLNVVRGAVLTPCGHRYCNKCITEWTGRNHTCPCCNSNLTIGQFYYDVLFDSLVDEILMARDKAEEAHFDYMFQGDTTDNAAKISSPFQDIFKKHIKTSLISFEKYFNKLHEDHDRKIRLLEANLEAESTGANELNKDDRKKSLEEKLKLSESLAVESFDRYLSTNIPSFEVLPVMVSVYVIDKQLRVPNICIQPNDSLTIIKSSIEAAMEEKLDNILSWTDEGEKLFLVGPLAKCEDYQLDQLSNGHGACVQLSWKSLPVFEHNLLPGSEIVLHGAFRSQSDIPKQCFAQVFEQAGNHTVDYFFCKNCNVKWICKSCSQSCHAGHEVVPFALNHKPTWACCYCPKKKLCKLQEPKKSGEAQNVEYFL